MGTSEVGHIGTVRWQEQLFLWSCHLYYVEDNPVEDDASFDATVKCLDLNQDLWSPVFRERLAFFGHDMRMSLKITAHAISLTKSEIRDAHTWAEYVKFLKRFTGR